MRRTTQTCPDGTLKRDDYSRLANGGCDRRGHLQPVGLLARVHSARLIGPADRRVSISAMTAVLPSAFVPTPIVRAGPSRDDAPAETIPGRDFIRSCPATVRAKLAAILIAVAAAPPYRFAGGGYWEAMHGDMAGWFEVRVDGPKPGRGKGRHHHRLYCLLDYDAKDIDKPLLVVVAGMAKPLRTTLSRADYRQVSELGAEYLARNPRSIT